MKFRIVPSTRDGRHQLLTTYLINDTLAIDAGAIAVGLGIEEQLRIRSIVLTHCHLDHVFSLPLYITDLYDSLREPVIVWCTESDHEALEQYLFNYRMWIPFEILRNERTELLDFRHYRAGESFESEGLRITPAPVTHTILTHGLLVEDDETALLFTSDTGATEKIWQLAARSPKLAAVFIDLSFPNRLTELARVSQHHSPITLVEELGKIRQDIRIIGIHLKTPYRDTVIEEIEALKNDRITIAEVGREYRFP
ncbi:MAG: MBL fold metallo-hydrolase [Acidobacteriota bacterium]|nr:MAG: MBL fold metallo-hydrolase [Acidobacteriota bacterium]